MPSVLLVGLKSDTVDFSDPDLPPGITAETIQAGIDLALKTMAERGWTTQFCGLSPDGTVEAILRDCLNARAWDCVVVGGGIRIPRANLELFERVVNAIHKGAPAAAIAFNTAPDKTPEAAARWI